MMVLIDNLQDAEVLINRLSQANFALQAQAEEERRAVEARVAELSLQLTRTHLQAEEAEQRLTEACRRATVKTFELSLDLGPTICRPKEAEAWAEEARDATVAAEDEAAESVAKAEEQVEVLR